MDTNYAPNSNKSKDDTIQKKDIKPVVTVPAKTKKKSTFEKFAGNFISEDAPRVSDYLFKDILIPAAKKLVSDVVTNGIDIILYGNSGRRTSNGIPATRYTSYNSIYDRQAQPRAASRPKYNYDEIVLQNRGEAEVVLNELNNIIRKYGQATVADLYDLVGMTGNFTDNDYGWTDLRYAEILRDRDGYWLKMPKPMPID